MSKPKLAVPPGATDTHIHIYLQDSPAVAGGPPIPGHFPVEKYRDVQRRLGLARVIWASNWPHPSAPKDRVPEDADLIDLLLDWAPDESNRKKILVDNPAQLFGF